ncbi:MAG: hypothetical protein HOE90_15705 [Bacteriovoracaceae bacterium]|nr:hypothetical protein [Bacteriovoracaceae bacterium]
MKSTLSPDQKVTYFFDKKKWAWNNQVNGLKLFLNFLRYLGTPKPISFSYISPKNDLIRDITIKENILLESIEADFMSTKENRFDQLIAESNNIYLEQILAKIPALDSLPQALDQKAQHMVSLIKGLLKPSEFIFYEEPSWELSPEEEVLIKKIFQFENRSLLVASSNEVLWKKSLDKSVIKSRQNGYSLIENELDRAGDESVLNFHYFGAKKAA